jgi:hypothetical protein
MKALLTVTAVGEAGAGAALVLAPSVVAAILLGSGLDTLTSMTVGRLAGGALLAIGVACWLERDLELRAAVGLIAALLLYNVAVSGILAASAVSAGISGIGLWPVVVLHAALACWCVQFLRPTRTEAVR